MKNGTRKYGVIMPNQTNKSVSAGTILILAWPTVLEEALNTGMQYIDGAMVGRIGANASAVVGLSLSVWWIMLGIFTALGAGVISCIAKATGSGDMLRVQSACKQTILIALICGSLLSIIGMGISPFLPNWLGASQEITEDASSYFFIISAALVFRAMTSICGAALRALGYPKIPMLVSLATIILKMILNYLLIYDTRTVTIGFLSFEIWGAGLGVLGAALASAICFVVNGTLMTIALIKSPGAEMKEIRLSLDRSVMREFVNVGMPVAIQRIIINLGNVVFTMLVARLGTIALATHSIALIAEQAFYIPGYGMQAAAATLAGRAAGERDARKLRRVTLMITAIASLVMIIMSIILFLYPHAVMRIFIKDPRVISAGAVLLRIVAVSEPLFAASVIMEGIFNGIGEVKTPFIASVFTMWGIRIVCTYICVVHLDLGLNSVWVCMVADNVIRCILLTIRFLHRNWEDYFNKYLVDTRKG